MVGKEKTSQRLKMSAFKVKPHQLYMRSSSLPDTHNQEKQECMFTNKKKVQTQRQNGKKMDGDRWSNDLTRILKMKVNVAESSKEGHFDKYHKYFQWLEQSYYRN